MVYVNDKNKIEIFLNFKLYQQKSLLAVELQLYYVLSEPVDFQWELSLYLNVH